MTVIVPSYPERAPSDGLQIPSATMADASTLLYASGILFLLTGMRFIVSLFSKDESGPFTFLLKDVQRCPQDKATTNDFYLLKARLMQVSAKNWTISMDFQFNKPFTENMTIRAEVAVQDWAGYRDHYKQFDFRGACTNLLYFTPQFFRLFLAATNATECPIPPGTYSLKNVPLEVLKPWVNLTKFSYGRYRTAAYISEEERNLGCIMIYYDIVPKQ